MSKKKKKTDLTIFENREPACEHFGLCGGCTHQKITYDRQLKMKAEEVCSLLDQVYDHYEFEGILPAPDEYGYRNKMEFTFGDECKEGPFSLGLHQRGSFMNIINLSACKLVHEDVNRVRNFTRDFFNPFYVNRQIDFHHKNTHSGWLRHLLVRRAYKTGELLIGLVTDSNIHGGNTQANADAGSLIREQDVLKSYVAGLQELELEGSVKGILHIVNDSLSDVVKNEKTEILFGDDYITEEVLGLKFRISAFSFFQTNTEGCEVLYRKVQEYAGDAHGTLFDLYSGTGTITQLMSSVVEKAVGVEIVEEAVKSAVCNAEINGIANVKFVADDVLKAVDHLGVPDSLILDPPREGINPKALGKILSWNVPKIVYVSCKPTSLARDLQAFKIAGYQIEKACCVDMFPQTGHIETVCLLSKLSEAKNHISVKVDMDEMDVTAAESKATYQEIQDWVREKYGFHVSHLNIAKTKRKCGIIERQNYNLPKSKDSRSPETPKEKEEAIIYAFKHFQMI